MPRTSNSKNIIHAYLKNREYSGDETGTSLESLTKKYPWFEGGQLLYALWKKQSGQPDADAQFSKAQLFISNPLQLNRLVQELEKTSIPEPVMTSPFVPQQEKKEGEFSFEPLHTVDYFASQGIRLQQEQLGTDNLSKQVKTFTQWLQSMKKIYHTSEQETPKTEDKTISHLADASNEAGDILTETMAEVLLQQGKKTQAIRIWEKLSLLHPEKSHYFATRISALK